MTASQREIPVGQYNQNAPLLRQTAYDRTLRLVSASALKQMQEASE